jgi:hypothetical protein
MGETVCRGQRGTSGKAYPVAWRMLYKGTMAVPLDLSRLLSLRFVVGSLLILVGLVYFATGWTVLGPIPLSQDFLHVLVVLFGSTLLMQSSGDSEDEEEPPEYGPDDQWEKENL